MLIPVILCIENVSGFLKSFSLRLEEKVNSCSEHLLLLILLLLFYYNYLFPRFYFFPSSISLCGIIKKKQRKKKKRERLFSSLSLSLFFSLYFPLVSFLLCLCDGVAKEDEEEGARAFSGELFLWCLLRRGMMPKHMKLGISPDRCDAPAETEKRMRDTAKEGKEEPQKIYNNKVEYGLTEEKKKKKEEET